MRVARSRRAPRGVPRTSDPRAWTRAPTPSFTPGALVGVSNGNRVPVPIIAMSTVGTRAFAFEAFAFAAQEEKARSEGASRDETSRDVPGDEARTARLEQLQNAYTNRAPSMGQHGAEDAGGVQGPRGDARGGFGEDQDRRDPRRGRSDRRGR